MPKEIVASEKVKPVADYSTGWKVSGGSLVLLAGQVSADVGGNIVGAGDIRAQAGQVFENIRAALEAAGASMRDVVRLTFYLTDRAHVPALREVRKEYLDEPYPANTLLIVNGLAHPEFLIEIDAVAFVEGG